MKILLSIAGSVAIFFCALSSEIALSAKSSKTPTPSKSGVTSFQSGATPPSMESLKGEKVKMPVEYVLVVAPPCNSCTMKTVDWGAVVQTVELPIFPVYTGSTAEIVAEIPKLPKSLANNVLVSDPTTGPSWFAFDAPRYYLVRASKIVKELEID